MTVEATTEEAPEPTTTEPELDPVEVEVLANAETCLREIQPIVKRLEELNGQLAINITYQEYRRMLGRVSTAYNGINTDALDLDCLDHRRCLRREGAELLHEGRKPPGATA